MKNLAIGTAEHAPFTLPLDAAVQTFAFIARKGAGKTYAAGKLVEELVDADVQCVVLDAVGNWYGLRIAANGKDRGLDMPVLGGLRGDVPLEPSAGALIADVVVDTGRSLILDVSQFSKADRQRFATAFGTRLWAKKKAEASPTAVHLVIEESQLIVPEQTHREADTARMIGVFNEIIRLGRNYGIGVTMITQRPQSVNKEVLNMTECLFVLQVNGAHERKALKEWIVHQGMDPKLLDELPSLPTGTAYVWSPQWLGILKKVQIGTKRTFDSTATPRPGQVRKRAELKPIDLGALKEQIAATLERAKADDPAELRRQIADLKRQLAAAPKPPPPAQAAPLLTDAQLKRLESLAGTLDKAHARFADVWNDGMAKTLAEAGRIAATLAGVIRHGPRAASTSQPQRPTGERGPTRGQRAERPIASLPAGATVNVNRTQQRVLDGMAWLESIGITEPAKAQVGFLAGIDHTGGHFTNTIGPLSTGGLIEHVPGGMRLTDLGRSVATPPRTPPDMASYHDAIRGVLRKRGGTCVRIFDAIVEGARTYEEIGAAAGIDHTGGHFTNMIGPLGTLGLVTRRNGEVTPTAILFPEHLR